MKLGIVALLSAFVAARAGAQCGQSGPTAPVAVPRTMVGLITDDNNNPLEHVEVILAKPRRKVATNSRGEFTITDLEPGKYPITVRRIGYEPGEAEVEVTKDGASARICVDVEPEPLAPLVTSISRGGLAGTVGDETYSMLAGAEVHAIGGGKSGITDSAGTFFLDLHPGTYGLQVTKKGYGTRVISVTIPKDSGRQVAIWLLPMTSGQQRREAFGLDSLRWRLLEKGTFNNLFSSQDLANTSRDLAQVIANRVVTTPDDNCDVIVNGEYMLPLWAIDKSDVELMEVYPHSMHSPRGVTSMRPGSSNPIKAQQGKQSACSAEVYVWLKK